MKRLRVDRWTGQLLVASSSRPATPGVAAALRSRRCLSTTTTTRHQSAVAAEAVAPIYENAENVAPSDLRFPPLDKTLPANASSLPSPLPERALHSPKLAALHARLTLSPKIPLQTLARALVDASADPNPQFNNSNLAFVGQTLINYHASEWFMMHYPRLPMEVLYAAMKGLGGDPSLNKVAMSWGIEAAAAPGGEVDPGLLQFSLESTGDSILGFGYKRSEVNKLQNSKWRRGVASRVVLDNDFGEIVSRNFGVKHDGEEAEPTEKDITSYGNAVKRAISQKAHANCMRAVVGAVYTHCGRDAVKSFIKAHVLSRTIDLSKLFEFKHPTLELAMLCSREEFEPPVARLLSETGRLSRTPVFVVGIYSGKDKLGEGSGASLEQARWKASMNALKAWYLYSPGEDVRMPSDMLEEDAKPWEPAYIDIGEIISR
ncbi:ribonuclease III domain-containing protein [Podospora australis]|uniref:Large ribosomal subunit protein mL44 n=1 Tax=Podospora australis TaxID=1536484 RepID=A0AAN6X4D7_9PEZI|nr:ribonuclease III domain-containing protein [Podospora australis]